MATSLLHTLQRLFWRSFFRLVVFTAALAEWLCAAWIAVVLFDLRIPWLAHLLGPVALHALNRRLLVAPQSSTPARPFARAYVGVVFTSLFGLVVLLINGAVWGLVASAFEVASAVGAPVVAADVLGPAAATGTAALALVSSLLAWGYGPGQRRVNVVEIDVPVRGLHPVFDGLRIAQLSDIHLGRYMTEDRLARHVEQTNALGADIICITGDITDGLDHAPRTFPVLDGLRAPLGVLAILGNHDFYTGADEVTATLRKFTSLRVLRDETVTFEREGARLHIHGVDDAGLDWTRGVREHDALPPLVARVPHGDASVLLSHRPDLFAQAADFGIGLVLSGHTHGGQLALPWPSARPSSLAAFITDFPRGTYQIGESTLHVNLGLGVTGQPVRVFSPREITLITLRTSETEPTGDL